MDRDRQWFKSSFGLDDTREARRELAFCDQAMCGSGVMVVPDATADSRFAGHDLVTGQPGIRFYAGAPLATPEGRPLGTLSVEFRFRHKQGHWIWIRRSARGHVGPDGRREVLAIWNDVTHEKRLTERLAQSAKLAQLGEVATGMAHELNQPLAGISLAAENALRSLVCLNDPPKRAQEKLSLIVDLTKRASDIIDHMRIFGRNDTAARGPVFLADALAGAEKLLTNRLSTGGVRLDIALPEVLPPVLGKSVPLE